MKIQRVIKTGDSLAVVIPSEMRRELGFSRGDIVRLEYITDKEQPLQSYGIAIWKIQGSFKESELTL